MRNLCPPSTTPCSPAPSRHLMIIRTDGQPLPPGAFSSFDKFFPQGFLNQTTPYQKHSSVLNSIPNADSDSTQPANNKKRWSLLRSMLPFGGSPSNNRPGEVTPPRSPGEGGPQLHEPANESSNAISRPATPPHQALSFRFSLEWAENRPNANKNRRLVAPLLPTNAQRILDRRRKSEEEAPSRSPVGTKRGEIRPQKPLDKDLATARYSGRALAEWAQVLQECRNFYLRRKQEGVPRDTLVETPTLGIETFRMLG
jgi:hypothetical protein